MCQLLPIHHLILAASLWVGTVVIPFGVWEIKSQLREWQGWESAFLQLNPRAPLTSVQLPWHETARLWILGSDSLCPSGGVDEPFPV